ncbi:MAG TPA: NADH-quinone oxidoreductase subunit L [Actinomycetota bacterium]|nr:NADH-quinone oxidoreductase subunit L [Actinomycetota bacterium]
MFTVGSASGVGNLLWLVPVVPLAIAVVNLFIGRRLGRLAGVVASVAVGLSFVLSSVIVMDLLSRPTEERLEIQRLYEWISVGRFSGGVDLRLDVLSATMILVITGVGFLIHVYAIGYMEGDPRYGRFFSYLNLFVFFMLLLVLADNYLLLYVGWEGVGLCSYLLIGFWFEKPENATAAKKAFVTTRIGDTAMLIGLALIVSKFGTLDFDAVLGAPGDTIAKGTATAISLLLFAGAIGKSAQVPLHVWLPDAMAGPTPVSALIHAATMVTAGVYLVVRSAPLFELSGVALTVVLIVGLVTALFAATCALAQDDIKRVLAYSTISQLGFMFMAAGMRFYTGAMFMLVAHAFYKALMFLGAGSVMHGMHEETDLQRMGGLIRRMPITGWTFVIGALALAGIWPLAGFFAKDQILEIANHTGRTWIYLLGTLGALLSALYIGRLVFLAFFGAPRSDEARHAHESPPVMTVPLVILAAGAVLAGLFLSTSAEGTLARFLEPITGPVPHGEGLSTLALSVIATAIALSALAVASWIYASGRVDWLGIRERLQPLPRAAASGWYVDHAYSTLFVKPGIAAARFSAEVLDSKGVDGLVNGVGGGVRRLAASGRRIQTGFVRSYALGFFLGAVGVLVWLGTRL